MAYRPFIEKQMEQGDFGFIDDLINRMGSKVLKTKKDTISRLITAFLSEPICNAFVERGGGEVLFTILENLDLSPKTDDKELLVGVLNLLHMVLYGRPKFIQKIFKKDDELIKKLVSLLRIPGDRLSDDMIRSYSLSVISDIASRAGKSKYVDKLHELGTLEALPPYLLSNEDDRKQVLRLMYNMSAKKLVVVEKMAQLGLIGGIVPIFETGSEEIKKECVFIIENIVSIGTVNHKKLLLQADCISALESSLLDECKDDFEVTDRIEKLVVQLRRFK